MQRSYYVLWCHEHHLEKLIWRHNSIGSGPIWMKFGRPMQHHMPVTIERTRSKPEVNSNMADVCFQKLVVVISLFNISARDWAISPKFGQYTDLDLLKWVTLLKLKREVQDEHKKDWTIWTAPYDSCWYFSSACILLHQILGRWWTTKYTVYHKVLLKYICKDDKSQ